MVTPVNGIYVLQGVVPSQIAAAPVGVKVVDLYDDDGNLFSTSQVAQMESGGGQVLGYFSIGEAENFRPYWSTLPSSILGPEDPSWPGDYQVAYWTPQWLTVSENYIQTMINQGYNGAFFDVVDEAEQPWAIANVPGHTLAAAEGAMVTLIQELANYAHAQDPNFQIWINSSGAEDMLANSTLDKTINGAYEEQLFYQTATQPTDSADLSYNLAYLDDLLAAGKPVVAVEYVSGASEVASVESQAKADGLGYYIANPNQQLDGVDTQGFTASGSGTGSGSGSTSGTPPTVSIKSATLSVTGNGGTVGLGISMTAPASSTATTLTITGLPHYERITDSLDGDTFKGSSITLTEAQVNSGLTLESTYKGSGHPSATLTITATDTISGVSYTSTPQTLVVKDPPNSAPASGADAMAKLLSAFEANGGAGSIASFASQESGGGHASTSPDFASLLANEGSAGSPYGSPAPLGDLLHTGMNIAGSASHGG